MSKEIVMYKEDWDELLKKVENDTFLHKQQIEINEVTMVAIKNIKATAPAKPLIEIDG